jgi:hypothetical protein
VVVKISLVRSRSPFGLFAGQPERRQYDRVVETLRTRHYSQRTEEAYVQWIRRFVRLHRGRHPRELAAGEVSGFLTHLVRGWLRYPDGAGTVRRFGGLRTSSRNSLNWLRRLCPASASAYFRSSVILSFTRLTRIDCSYSQWLIIADGRVTGSAASTRSRRSGMPECLTKACTRPPKNRAAGYQRGEPVGGAPVGRESGVSPAAA